MRKGDKKARLSFIKETKKKGKAVKLYPLLVLSIHQKISLRCYRKYLLSPVHPLHSLTLSASQL